MITQSPSRGATDQNSNDLTRTSARSAFSSCVIGPKTTRFTIQSVYAAPRTTALAASGDKEEAVSHLLESFRRDRKWNDEAARKQLVELFDAWGPKDPATLDGRRRLSSLLFS